MGVPPAHPRSVLLRASLFRWTLIAATIGGGSAMPVAFNAVRFRVKPGREQEFLDAHKNVANDWPGLRHVNLIKTGDRTYCIIGEWDSMDAIAKVRPQMIATLD